MNGSVYRDTYIRTAWGLQRAGARIEAAVNNAIRIVTENGKITLKDDFLTVIDSDIKIRNRQNVSSQTLRKPENISSYEISAGIIETISKSFGATADELIIAVSRMLGFKSTSSLLRSSINDTISSLISSKKVRLENGLLTL